MAIKSLIINPGSTSTKIGVFEDETLLFEKTLRHSTEEIAQYATIADQKDFRKEIIVLSPMIHPELIMAPINITTSFPISTFSRMIAPYSILAYLSFISNKSIALFTHKVSTL